MNCRPVTNKKFQQPEEHWPRRNASVPTSVCGSRVAIRWVKCYSNLCSHTQVYAFSKSVMARLWHPGIRYLLRLGLSSDCLKIVQGYVGSRCTLCNEGTGSLVRDTARVYQIWCITCFVGLSATIPLSSTGQRLWYRFNSCGEISTVFYTNEVHDFDFDTDSGCQIEDL